MRKSLSLFLCAFLLLSCSRKPASTTLAITHVTVIDATGAPPAPDQTVLIDNQKIVALGPSASTFIPSGAQILDASGKFLIPGLADMHLHLTGAGEPGGSREFFLPLLLANGVTSVRDMGGYLDSLVPLRDEIEKGKRLGPRIAFAGPYLDGTPPSFQPSFVVTNRVQANEDVRNLIQRKVDFIKVQSRLSRDAYFAIADACKREHITFVGHVPDRVTAWEAADAGQKSIEHLTCVLRACSRDEARLLRAQFHAPQGETPAQSKARQLHWNSLLSSTYSEAQAQKLIEKFREKETWQTPTLILLKNDAYPLPSENLSDDPRAQYIPKSFFEVWKKTYTQQMQEASAAELETRAALFAKSEHLVGEMQKNGVNILAGTDSAAPFVFPGSSLHEELALLVQAGLTPLQALQSATKNAAEFLGKSDQWGTITAGKSADLVLLDANPLENIANTKKIRAVILRGKLLDRTFLDSQLASARTYAATH